MAQFPRLSLLALAAALAALPACKPASAPAGQDANAPVNSAVATPTQGDHASTGVIQSFQSDNKIVVLKHEAIPGVMEGMTMGFELRDAKMAQGLKPGDKVAFVLTIHGDSYLITSLKKI